MAAAMTAGHVVVIDDAPDLLTFYQEFLSGEGYRVTSFPDVVDDPAEVLRLSPDLIVPDLVFDGEKRGPTFLRQLRTDSAGAAVGVLVCSAASGALQQHAADLLALGAESLAKPFDVEDLLAQARRFCARSARVRRRAAAAVDAMRAAAERGQAAHDRSLGLEEKR